MITGKKDLDLRKLKEGTVFQEGNQNKGRVKKLPGGAWLILRIIAGILLGLVTVFSGLFGYISWRAKAKKWSVGMFGILIVAIFLFYRIVLGDPLAVIPF